MRMNYILLMAIVFIFVFLIFAISLSQERITGNLIKEDTKTWTKAVCNGTHCQDYEIVCKGKNLIQRTPLTGSIMEIPLGWEDPRNETEKKRLC